jgi:hypothetical protein
MHNWIDGIDVDLGEDTPAPSDIVESWAFIYVRRAAGPHGRSNGGEPDGADACWSRVPARGM